MIQATRETSPSTAGAGGASAGPDEVRPPSGDGKPFADVNGLRQIGRAAGRETDAKGPVRAHPPDAAPLLNFAVVGAQKCGTTALRRFLAAHPEIGMCPDEMHLFDAPDYSTCWTSAHIDQRYRSALGSGCSAAVRGECTPVYMFLPEVAARLARYNPSLKLIVLLRDPVQRAISAYYMEKHRGGENKPLWLALLLEPLRCRLDKDHRPLTSARRQHTYRRRGLYSKQLRNLCRHFAPSQVLIVQNAELRRHHHRTLRRVFAFLGVADDVRVPAEIVFANPARPKKHRVVRLLLGASYCVERRRLAAILRTRSSARETVSLEQAQ